MKNLTSKLLAAAILFAAPLLSNAASIQLGGPDRYATLGDATQGFTGSGNPLTGNINTLFGGSWTKEGDVNNISGLSDGYLTITMDGAWGGQPVITGTWTIADSFFDLYGSAVVSIHVGNGNGEPDFFAWLVTGKSGTWSYDANEGRGGGLSNLGLWGSGTPSRVPDGGTTAILLGLSVIGFGLVARRQVA